MSLDMEQCPNCGVSWIGDPIPKEHQANYSGTHFKREIGIQYSYDHPEHYDGISEYMCPDCKTRFGRWTGKKLAESESEKRYGGNK